MAVRHMDVKFENGFNGVAKAPKAELKIGVNTGEVLPYDMLFAALASCLYATFMDIVEKKKITYDSCTIEVTGEKRDEVPATLKWVNVGFNIEGLQEGKEKGITKSAELATKYCSIYQTIAQVAKMSFEVKF